MPAPNGWSSGTIDRNTPTATVGGRSTRLSNPAAKGGPRSRLRFPHGPVPEVRPGPLTVAPAMRWCAGTRSQCRPARAIAATDTRQHPAARRAAAAAATVVPVVTTSSTSSACPVTRRWATTAAVAAQARSTSIAPSPRPCCPRSRARPRTCSALAWGRSSWSATAAASRSAWSKPRRRRRRGSAGTPQTRSIAGQSVPCRRTAPATDDARRPNTPRQPSNLPARTVAATVPVHGCAAAVAATAVRSSGQGARDRPAGAAQRGQLGRSGVTSQPHDEHQARPALPSMRRPQTAQRGGATKSTSHASGRRIVESCRGAWPMRSACHPGSECGSVRHGPVDGLGRACQAREVRRPSGPGSRRRERSRRRPRLRPPRSPRRGSFRHRPRGRW